MCGRYSMTTTTDDLAQRFDFDPDRANKLQSNNITPSRTALVIASPKGTRLPAPMVWGFPNHRSASDSSSRIINARSETAAEKPTFSYSYRKRRCIIPATAFFESKATQHGRIPYRIRLQSGAPFAMAGLWKPRHTSGTKPVFEFVILTVPPNEEVAHIHDRMPAILLPQDEQAWLDHNTDDPKHLDHLLNPYPSHFMEAHPFTIPRRTTAAHIS